MAGLRGREPRLEQRDLDARPPDASPEPPAATGSSARVLLWFAVPLLLIVIWALLLEPLLP